MIFVLLFWFACYGFGCLCLFGLLELLWCFDFCLVCLSVFWFIVIWWLVVVVYCDCCLLVALFVFVLLVADGVLVLF